MRLLLRQMTPAILAFAVFTLLLGVAYPIVVTGVAQVAFNEEANGSLIKQGDAIRGSKLLGQSFVSPQYFHPRPSSAGTGYDATSSSGSNLGPTNESLLQSVAERIEKYRADNKLSSSTPVPVDAVTASASGLDPHISIANAMLQAPRVAAERNMTVSKVKNFIRDFTMERNLLVLGEPGVNILSLNIALDNATGSN